MIRTGLVVLAGAAALIGTVTASPIAHATEGPPIARGTEGLVAVPFLAENRGDGPLACAAALAHWYSADLGRAEPGGQIRATLWYDGRDGTLLMLNAAADRMPVQALWCGSAGRAWTDGARVPLDPRIGKKPSPIRLVCDGHDLVCR